MGGDGRWPIATHSNGHRSLTGNHVMFPCKMQQQFSSQHIVLTHARSRYFQGELRILCLTTRAQFLGFPELLLAAALSMLAGTRHSGIKILAEGIFMLAFCRLLLSSTSPSLGLISTTVQLRATLEWLLHCQNVQCASSIGIIRVITAKHVTTLLIRMYFSSSARVVSATVRY